MKKTIVIASCLLILASCGGSSGEGSDSPAFNINPEGGMVERPGIATIEFPKGAFDAESSISVVEESNKEILSDYEETRTMFDAGISAKNYLRITSTLLPRMDSVIHYTVPREFTDSLGSDFKPRLFVMIFQSGADGERLDNFEPLDFNLQSGVLTAMIPKEAFTNARHEDDDLFEAIVIVGSSPASRVKNIPLTKTQCFFRLFKGSFKMSIKELLLGIAKCVTGG